MAARWIAWTGEDASQLAELHEATSVFHVAPAHSSFGRLRSQGIDVQPLEPGTWPEAGLVVIPQGNETLGRFEYLVYVVDRLLGPGGCPWDQEQTVESLKPYLLEESYELFEAIDSGDRDKIVEELGDVLLQPVMQAQIAWKDGAFSIDDVIAAITDKLVRRHPHVFGSSTASTADQVLRQWDAIKQAERAESAPTKRALLEGVPKAMPALARAMEISKRAARAGFEWPDLDAVLDKLDEERQEFDAARANGDTEAMAEELGDMLFTLVNVARWLGIDAEDALRTMIGRFTRRFEAMEALAAGPLESVDAETWDRLWNQAKAAENR